MEDKAFTQRVVPSIEILTYPHTNKNKYALVTENIIVCLNISIDQVYYPGCHERLNLFSYLGFVPMRRTRSASSTPAMVVFRR